MMGKLGIGFAAGVLLSAASPDPLQLHRTAQIQARIFATHLIPIVESEVRSGRVVVSIEPESEMPRPAARFRADSNTRLLAHTTRPSSLVPGCIIHLSEGVEKWADVIAHEVCHCVFDNEAIDEDGYKRGTTTREIDEREAMAQECTRGLMKEALVLEGLKK